jgi:hypothetical protein
MRGHSQQRGKHSWRVKVFVGRDDSGVRRYVQRTVGARAGMPNESAMRAGVQDARLALTQGFLQTTCRY